MPGSDKTRLFVKLAFGAGEQIIGFDVPLGNRPGAFIFVSPIGPTGMGEQHFKPGLAAEREDAGADLGSTGHWHFSSDGEKSKTRAGPYSKCEDVMAALPRDLPRTFNRIRDVLAIGRRKTYPDAKIWQFGMRVVPAVE